MHRRAAAIAMLATAIVPAGCAAPQAPARPAPAPGLPMLAARLDRLLPADMLLIGEQHDVAEHQQTHLAVVRTLSERGMLAALALEMAEQGRTTQGLPRDAGEQQVQAALLWDAKAWPWSAYGPAVMAAVSAGVPVLGANLPRARLREAMSDARMDMQLPGPALKAQQQAIRLGHCGALPESQITPMTRVQVARDMAMAQTLAAAAVPGRVVVLLSGSGHADTALGVPQHLPRGLVVRSVRLLAEGTPASPERFDSVWLVGQAPQRDYCADLQRPTQPRS